MARVQLERVLKAQDGVRRTSHVGENIAEISPKVGVIRLELHRLVERRKRLFAPTLLQQHGAEACQIVCFWLLPDRARYPLQRMIVLLGVKGQETHQMQGIRVFRIHSQALAGSKAGRRDAGRRGNAEGRPHGALQAYSPSACSGLTWSSWWRPCVRGGSSAHFNPMCSSIRRIIIAIREGLAP